ncbi:MAG: uroporphyrinogen decarboxylase family protein [Dehalococcoidales bacterium]
MVMTKRERIKAALAGKTVDRVPVGFWRHWPGDDQLAKSLAQVTLKFQQQYDLDFIKIPVTSTYCVEDYGAKHEYRGNLIGDREFLDHVIKNIEDWNRIEPLDITRGKYGEHLQALRMVLEKREAGTPVIFTIFNPMAMASYLAGDETLLIHLRSDPDKVEPALKALTATCANFVKAVISEGADGIFLSTRWASYELMSEEEYLRFGKPGDLSVLAASSGGWFNILHLHGQHPMFNLLADYPVQAINWHDRTAWPGLTEAKKLFHGVLMGGIEQYKILNSGSPAAVESQVHDAINSTRGSRLIITPGCTYPLSVPHSNLMAMRKAVDTYHKKEKAGLY